MSVSKKTKKQYKKVKEAYVAFDYENKTYRLPVNPETFEVNSVMETETYDVLGVGQIVVASGLEVREFSFETELPYKKHSYVETAKKFLTVDKYEALFRKVRKRKEPINFQYDNGVSTEISTKVLIVEFNTTENAGEEGDKQCEFKLVEYADYGAKIISNSKKKNKSKQSSSKKSNTSNKNSSTSKKKTTVTKKKVTTAKKNPKKPSTYVVKKGDCLWNLAKKFYGSGAKYTKIYNANRSIVKNPALIYPGMKLTIPD